MGTDDILDAFMYYWYKDLPILITTDAMLQTWHLVFDAILERNEETLMFPLLVNLSRSMIDVLKNEISDDLPIERKVTLTYLSVALLLVNRFEKIPEIVIEPETVTRIASSVTYSDFYTRTSYESSKVISEIDKNSDLIIGFDFYTSSILLIVVSFGLFSKKRIKK